MSDTDLTASPAQDLPTMLHLLAAHITENPIPEPYGFFPLYDGGVRVMFHASDMAAALRFAASLSDRSVQTRHYPADDTNALGREFYGVTVTGTALTLPVEVVVNPDAVEGDTVESVTARVESDLDVLAAESRETTALVGAVS